MKCFFMRKLSCTEQTAPLRSYGDTSRRIRKLNKHPIDALILRRGGILAHSRGREKDSGERNGRHLHEALVQRIRRRERREARRDAETWQSEWTDYTAYRVLAGLNEYCRRYPGVPNSTLLPPSLEYPLSLVWRRVTDLRSSILSLSSSFRILSLLYNILRQIFEFLLNVLNCSTDF